MKSETVWTKITKTYYIASEKCLMIDGWEDEHNSKVIAKVYGKPKGETEVEYTDERAKKDVYAQEVINAAKLEVNAFPPMTNLTNKEFFYLKALYPTEKRKGSGVVWRCVCRCGNEIDVSARQLVTGRVGSCGCFPSKKEVSIQIRKYEKIKRIYLKGSYVKSTQRKPYERHKPLKNQERDKAIVDAWIEGDTQRKIADRFGVSHQRVSQVIKKYSSVEDIENRKNNLKLKGIKNEN